MIHRVLLCALLAGLVAGVAVTAVQAVAVLPLIERAEVIEQGAPPSSPSAPDHGHDEAAGHDGPDFAETMLANGLTGVGFGFLLVAVMAMAGRPVDFRRGLLWGAGGFLAVALLPAIGLPPKPPGAPIPLLAEAQNWWLACVLFSTAGLLLFAFSKQWIWRALALALLVAPHVWGAPESFGDMDPALAPIMLDFRMASLAASAVFWSALGGTAGLVYRKIIG